MQTFKEPLQSTRFSLCGHVSDSFSPLRGNQFDSKTSNYSKIILSGLKYPRRYHDMCVIDQACQDG